MPRRPTGTKYWKGSGAGGTVMTGIGNLYSITMSWAGATAGNRVLILDGSEPIFEFIIAEAANSNESPHLPEVGIQFGTSLVVQYAGAGEINIMIGYEPNN